jgi:low affinity Fe/Cu permease
MVMFSKFSKWVSKILGLSSTFAFSVILIVVWLLSGPLYHFSDSWQLIINTTTTIVTFLMVFLIQNTQNRDTIAIHLKLDEIIRAMSNTHNQLLKVEELSDDDLEKMLKCYENLADEVQKRVKKGLPDKGVIDIKTNNSD